MQPQNPLHHAIGRALSGFLAMLPVLLGVYWLDPDLSALALTDFALGLRRLLPVFGVMLVLMVLVNLWVKPQRIARHLGEESGLRGWAIAITAGVVSLVSHAGGA